MIRPMLLLLSALACLISYPQRIPIPDGVEKIDLRFETDLSQSSRIDITSENGQRITISTPDFVPSELYSKIDVDIDINGTVFKAWLPYNGEKAKMKARLILTETEATALIENNQAVAPSRAPYLLHLPDTIQLSSNREILKFNHDIVKKHQSERSSFATLYELKAHLADSNDANESIWKFFDHVNNPLKSSLGGKYKIATVANESGYDIVYIDGAEENKQLWEALTIKGRLERDSLNGTFILKWIDADGKEISYETSATIEGNFLTLFFPYWKTTLRFAKTELD